MEGPSSRLCRATVSASGMHLQACLPLAQPRDTTNDEMVVASPTEQHPLKPSPPLPRVGGVPMRVLFGRGVTLSFFSRLSNVEMESIPINFYFIMMAVMERALPEYW
jgi:hypothetical protein